MTLRVAVLCSEPEIPKPVHGSRFFYGVERPIDILVVGNDFELSAAAECLHRGNGITKVVLSQS